MTLMTQRRITVPALAGVFLVALAACTPTDEPPTPSPSSPSESPTQAKPPTLSYEGDLIEVSVGSQPTICGKQVGIGGARPGEVHLGWEYPNNEWYAVGDTFEPTPGCVVMVISVTEGTGEANPGTVELAVNET